VARFREPFRASKSRKGRTVRPNPGQTPFRHVVEVKPGISDAAWQAKHLPVDSPSGCGCPSRAGMPSAVFHNSHKGHRPIVTAHRDGFSHDRRSLALGAIGHVWEANALACNAIEETCSRTALFREKTCLSSDRKAQFSLNRMLDGASERICPCFTRS
jgi:hypothetical protein